MHVRPSCFRQRQGISAATTTTLELCALYIRYNVRNCAPGHTGDVAEGLLAAKTHLKLSDHLVQLGGQPLAERFEPPAAVAAAADEAEAEAGPQAAVPEAQVEAESQAAVACEAVAVKAAWAGHQRGRRWQAQAWRDGPESPLEPKLPAVPGGLAAKGQKADEPPAAAAWPPMPLARKQMSEELLAVVGLVWMQAWPAQPQL